MANLNINGIDELVLEIPNASSAESVTGGSVTVSYSSNGNGDIVLTDSPVLTGDPEAPTQTQGDNSTKLATTAYVDGTLAVFVKVNGVPI